MTLETLLRQHAEAAHDTVKEAQPPPLARITHRAHRSWRMTVGVAFVTIVATAGLVVLLLSGPTTDETPPPPLQSPSTTLTSNEDDNYEAVVTTTMPIPSQLEPAGVELQNEILADGNITQEEFTRAIAGMAECMTAHGVTGVTWSVDDYESTFFSWSMGYDSLDTTTESLCYYSYVDRVVSALVESHRRDLFESP
jgi:hypothetical protein